MDLNSGKKVLFATMERIQNRWRFKGIDGIGILSTTDDGVRFKGKRHDFEVSEIQAVSMVMVKVPPIRAIAITTLLIVTGVLFFYGSFFRLLSEGLDASFFGICILDVSDVLCFSPFIVIMFFLRMKYWICVEYKGANEQSREAFFRQLPGRKTEALFNQLRELTVEEK